MPIAIASTFLVLAGLAQAPAPDRRLLDEDPASLAEAATVEGDAARGAAVFYRPHLACAKCHEADGGSRPVGPELASLGREVATDHLVASVLEPSRFIAKGYETVSIATDDGRVVSGLVAEDRPDAVTILDPAGVAATVTIPRASIEGRTASATSAMPAGLVNGLSTRREFLDLVRYLRAIADGGPDAARALRPDDAAIAKGGAPADAERDLDHAGLIAGLDKEALLRGAAIYGRVCFTCHGSRDREGSMPTSPRFGATPLKNGTDPYSLYKTLTAGFGQMPAQPWMVPSQKYDVIHYVRELFLKPVPSMYPRVDRAYLSGLPKGSSRGPAPVVVEPWSAMDYGPSLMATYEVGEGPNIAAKGVAIRLDPGPGGVAKGRNWAVYDHDTMAMAAVWSGRGFIDWRGISFDGRHESHAKIVADPVRKAVLRPGPGWADPVTGRFDDPRPLSREGRPYGPLPRDWAKYKGVYHHGGRVILSYTIGDAEILDSPGMEAVPGAPERVVFSRTIEVGKSSRDLRLRVAPRGTGVALIGEIDRNRIFNVDGEVRLTIPAELTPLTFKLVLAIGNPGPLLAYVRSPPPAPLRPLTLGGPRRWPEALTTRMIVGRSDRPFAVDALPHPEPTPWKSQFRFTGLDFTPDGKSLVACDWDGDVWRVDGLDDPKHVLTWRRVASGLFQPLGLKVVDGQIYIGCRDQIAILRDSNGDGETDFVECFNDDHQVTESFHEFAMDLQVGPSGEFYYTKGARHGKPATVPHHGTLLRVSPDGSRTDILARGFRAPNGVLPNPDGTFFVTDQEGHWIPKNRINWVKPGGFYGNMWGFHDLTDPSDAAMDDPVCWITNAMDRSPAQLLRVDSPSWGPLVGSLLSLSYGTGKVFVVPTERVGGRMQGGVVALPIPQFPTGVMRGRFRPADGHLYVCGMYAWAGNQQEPGGLYRIRPTGRPSALPIALHARRSGLAITFSSPLDPSSATDASHYRVKTWTIDRTANYGSKHRDERPRLVRSAVLSDDRRTVTLDVEGLGPTRGMEVAYGIRGEDGMGVEGVVHNTIHELGD